MDAYQLKEELVKKKQLYNSVKLDRLPDKGARLKQQIDDLQTTLEKLTVSEKRTEKPNDPATLEYVDKKRDNHLGKSVDPERSDIKTDVEKGANSISVEGSSRLTADRPGEAEASCETTKLNCVTKSVSETKVLGSKLNKGSLALSEFNTCAKKLPETLPKPCDTKVPEKCPSDTALFNCDSNVLSFADLKSKQHVTGKEPPLVPKSPAFSQYRSKSNGRIKLTEALSLPKHLLKEGSKLVPGLGSTKQYEPKIIQAKETAAESIYMSLVSCPSELDEESDPKGLKTSLMKHQKQALTWLLWRETQAPRGGIFADDMGLGKTLSMIALVLKSKEQNLQNVDGRKVHPTLIVCLPSIIHQWDREIIRHCKHNALKVLVYHGPKRETDVKNFYFYDIVLTTYNLILSEGKSLTQKNKPSPLLSMLWNRIILDEAHTIKNHKSQTARWVFELQSASRWAVTGTPIHNDLKDLYCLMKYLRCRPFDDYDVWKKLINDFSDNSEKRRNALMQSILLRRSKNEQTEDGQALVPLPQKHFKTHQVKLSDKEMDIYKKVYSRLQPKISDFLVPSSIKERRCKSKNAFLLTMLLKLQQCCNHPSLVKSATEDDESVVGNDSISDVLNSLSSLQIDNSVSSDDSSQFNMSVVEEEVDFPMAEKSAKIRLLLQKLPEILVRKEKVVVVSQWVSMLEVVSLHLKKAKISFHVIKGATKPEDRSKVTEDFNSNPDGPPVLLLSLKAGGVGLNLVGGNHMFLLDLHWNPALEMQASDRVYRVGQKHEVYIHKFVCKSTIEEKIHEMQEQKKRVASVVLEGAKRDGAHLTMNDLKQLFSI